MGNLFSRFIILAACALAGCSPKAESQAAAPEPLTVFAAASLTDAFEEISKEYQKETGQAVRLSFGASGAVARQVQSGAPADVVVLADEQWMTTLSGADVIADASRLDLLRNTLVVIAARDAAVKGEPFAWMAAQDGKLALGDPESVPAGAYAREWLMRTGQWDALQPRIVTAADVRAVRTFVERGEAALGVAYKSDAVAPKGVKVVLEPGAAQQPRIVYPAALTKQAKAGADRFLAYLQGDAARAVFARNGFQPAR